MSQENTFPPTPEGTFNCKKYPLPSPQTPTTAHTKPMTPISSFPSERQLLLDEEALRETLEEEARQEKELEERMRQEQARDELFRSEFGVISDSESDNLLKFVDRAECNGKVDQAECNGKVRTYRSVVPIVEQLRNGVVEKLAFSALVKCTSAISASLAYAAVFQIL
ncbi:hypothetical protein Tco_0689441 [Tanacetum coccineum]